MKQGTGAEVGQPIEQGTVEEKGLTWGMSLGFSGSLYLAVCFIWPIIFGEPRFDMIFFSFFIFPFLFVPIVAVFIKTISEGVADIKNEGNGKVDEVVSRKQQLKVIWSITFWLFALAGFIAYRIFVTK